MKHLIPLTTTECKVIVKALRKAYWRASEIDKKIGDKLISEIIDVVNEDSEGENE